MIPSIGEKMKKNILIIVGVIVLVSLVVAGGFWGGMTYQSNQNTQAQARFFEQRGGVPPDGQITEGQFPGELQFQGLNPGDMIPIQGFQRGGIMGQVKSIDGNVLTLSTAQDVTTVNLTDAIIILKSVEGSIGDLQSGVRVMVSGEKDDNGDFTASQITILNDESLAAPAGTAP
jgi:preprotein translocase subunit YajC